MPDLLHQHRRIAIERDPDVPGPGRQRQPQRNSGIGAYDELLDGLAIDCHLEPMLLAQPAGATELDTQVVVGIEGKQVGKQHATSGAERQADGAFVLLLVLGVAESLGERYRWRAPYRESADGAAGIQIPLQQRL